MTLEDLVPTLPDVARRVIDFLRALLTRLSQPGPFWALKIGLVVMAVSFVHATPAYDSLPGRNTVFFRQKGLHLLTHFGGDDPRGHAAKLDFRLLGPIVLRPFGGSV